MTVQPMLGFAKMPQFQHPHHKKRHFVGRNCCACVPIRAAVALMTFVIALYSVVSMTTPFTSSVNALVGGYGRGTEIAVAFAGLAGFIISSLGLFGIYDNNRAILSLFYQFLMLRVLVSIGTFIIDMVSLLECENVGISMHTRMFYNPALEELKANHTCKVSRNLYVLFFLFDLYFCTYCVYLVQQYIENIDDYRAHRHQQRLEKAHLKDRYEDPEDDDLHAHQQDQAGYGAVQQAGHPVKPPPSGGHPEIYADPFLAVKAPSGSLAVMPPPMLHPHPIPTVPPPPMVSWAPQTVMLPPTPPPSPPMTSTMAMAPQSVFLPPTPPPSPPITSAMFAPQTVALPSTPPPSPPMTSTMMGATMLMGPPVQRPAAYPAGPPVQRPAAYPAMPSMAYAAAPVMMPPTPLPSPPVSSRALGKDGDEDFASSREPSPAPSALSAGPPRATSPLRPVQTMAFPPTAPPQPLPVATSMPSLHQHPAGMPSLHQHSASVPNFVPGSTSFPSHPAGASFVVPRSSFAANPGSPRGAVLLPGGAGQNPFSSV